MAERKTSNPLPDDPLWFKDAVIYQTHVKAFLDSNGDGVGDFEGLTQKLDYVRDLGVNTLWLLPFFPSPMRDDGYDIADYRNIFPDYGNRRSFRRFVREAHRRGLRIIIELVINHTSDQHPWFQAARQAAPGSRKRNFYVWSDSDQAFPETRIIFTDSESSNWAWDPVAQQYYWHRFFSHQPDLNHNNPEVVRAVIRLMRFWLDIGVDGLRLDAIPYLCVRQGTNNENLPETHAVIRRMRAVVDEHYRDRMFLAEANQWPEDAAEYFGNGDECHMAYHFPLMPRIYMAVAQEDRHPIIEIIDQTPEIPEGCQWAIFLRNHDELTLEMVTDRERDYMYQTYASDPRMRVNVGIRRRLAPLMDNDPDRIKLLNSLLLSMPGSPIVYYGDEIGMGDNFFLGDRNGVRTPMQWTPDRNAGFSRADPQRLYLPPIMDPIYGYASVNVEAQERDPASLLNWMKRLIAVRKSHQVFGRGRLRFLHPGNRKVLAYVRDSEQEVVLCVANLGRGAQPVELNLAEYSGRVPVELLGRTTFPPIGELPYLLTLAGHGFYWFLLATDIEAPHWHEEHLPTHRLAVLVLPEGLQTLRPESTSRTEVTRRALQTLENSVLPAYLSTRRWFAAKGTPIVAVRLVEHQQWRDWLLTFVEVRLADGTAQRYFLPLGLVWEEREEQPGPLWAAAMCRIRRQAVTGLMVDAFEDERFLRALLGAIVDGEQTSFGAGRLSFSATTALPALLAKPAVEQSVRRPATEGSNSAAIIDGRLFFKGYRRLQPGANPELEMGRFLTETAGYGRIVPLGGSVEHLAEDGTPSTLGLLQVYVENQGDAWSHTIGHLERVLEGYGALPGPGEGQDVHAAYLTLTDTLGRRTAELHRALAREGSGPAFEPEPITGRDLASWREQVQHEAVMTLERLSAHLGALPERSRGLAESLCTRRDALLAQLSALVPEHTTATRIRYHGDFHLGQVLVAENDVILIDFEGEPARPLAERARKHSPLRDVAGMLRSFDYAAQVALERVCADRPHDREQLAPRVDDWRQRATQRFLSAYRETATGASFYPADPSHAEALLTLFVIDKALYEVRYELDNRPDWVGVPLEGLRLTLPHASDAPASDAT
ncbi:MAG: maltose alpha-D-glucosyltransferase [Gammaproteobacteria bacterium]|jgi:maltose alpha-D-glucosyltransferase/alpha-amylase